MWDAICCSENKGSLCQGCHFSFHCDGFSSSAHWRVVNQLHLQHTDLRHPTYTCHAKSSSSSVSHVTTFQRLMPFVLHVQSIYYKSQTPLTTDDRKKSERAFGFRKPLICIHLCVVWKSVSRLASTCLSCVIRHTQYQILNDQSHTVVIMQLHCRLTALNYIIK